MVEGPGGCRCDGFSLHVRLFSGKRHEQDSRGVCLDSSGVEPALQSACQQGSALSGGRCGSIRSAATLVAGV